MKKIIFPTDFSDISKNAFLYALHLAKNTNSEIVTLHTYEYPTMNYMDVPVYLPEIYEVTELSQFENYKGHIPVLHEIAAKHKLNHVKMSNVLESGDLIDNIINLTKKEGAEYIVMGTKGATGLAATFFGSTTEKVMNDCNSVVIAIPEDCKYQPIKKILFITEFKTEEIEVLKKALAIAKVFHSHVDCLYAKPKENPVDDAIVHDWKVMFSNHDVSFHCIESDDKEGLILEFIPLYHINMLAMTTHHRNFFQRIFDVSLSRKLAFHTNIPILAFHP
jgi:nucleotide-binding universal stress UspA family protein